MIISHGALTTWFRFHETLIPDIGMLGLQSAVLKLVCKHSIFFQNSKLFADLFLYEKRYS